MKTREEAISKVQKLLSLAQSSNEHEAAFAATKAREIVSQYNINLASLPHQSVDTTLGIVEFETEIDKTAGYWSMDLRDHIARGFQCRTFTRYNQVSGAPIVIFIGTSLDSETAATTFQFLKRTLEGFVDKKLPDLKISNPDWDEAVLKNSYLEGAAERLGERFDEEVLKIQTAERKQCQDLVVLKSRNLNDYMKNKHSKFKVKVIFRDDLKLCPKAYSVGYTDAESLAL